MRSWLFILTLPLILGMPAYAQDLASTCHATSAYDLTLLPGALQFDRAAPAPLRVEVGGGSLRVGGVQVRVDATERGRLIAFEHDLRALVPRVRAVAVQGVDLATQSVRAEAERLGLSPATRAELDRRVAVDATKLKQRIAASQSTLEWHGPAFERYVSNLSADLLPLVTADLGQQAVQAALSGDMQAALSLRDAGISVTGGMQSRLYERMQALRPSIAALCPSIRHLAELQQGFAGPTGEPLHLLEIKP